MGRQPAPGSPEDWRAFAESDLSLARLASSHHEIRPEQCCFHAQQAAEKGIKAVLVARTIEFHYTHDIDELVEIATRGGISVPADIAEAGSLTPYAILTRYPGYWKEITPADVDEAIRLAERVVAWAAAAVAGRQGP